MLEAIRNAWVRRDLADLDEGLLALWRETPDPFVAAMLGEISEERAKTWSKKDFDDLPGTLPPAAALPLIEPWVRKPGKKGVEVAHRVNALHAHYTPDPRLADLIVRLMRDCPAPRSVPLDRALWATLYDQRDPRTADQLRFSVERSERRWRARPDAEDWRDGRFVTDGVGQVFNRKLAQFHEDAHGPEWQVRRVSKPVRTELLALRRAIRTEQRLGPAGQDGLALLEAVCRAPEDDTPRLVYADLLTAHGSPRGEFIVLHVAEAAGTLDKEGRARMKALWKAHHKEWVKGIRPAIRLRQKDFERGFYSTAKLVKSDPKTQHEVFGSKEWATVHTALLDRPAHAVLLVDGAFRSLRTVEGVGPLADVGRIAALHPGLHHLRFDPDVRHTKPPGAPCGLRRLRTLHVHRFQQAGIGWMLADLARPLRVLRIHHALTDVSRTFEHVPAALTQASEHVSLTKRTELEVELPDAAAEIHLRMTEGRVQLAVELSGLHDLQERMLQALPKGPEVLVVRCDVQAAARRRFPNARIRRRRVET